MKTKAKAKKSPGKKGRPTKYSSTMLAKARKYVSECADEFYDYIKSESDKGATQEQKVWANIPTVEGLALELSVNPDTLYEWAKHHPSFSETLRDLVHKQKKMLIKGGLSGYYNPTIAKLVLSANHGMTERTDVTSGDKPIEGNSITFVSMNPDNEAGS
ncbi:MAG: terminase small subunit [Paracoccaceae bacterium]